MNHTEHYQLSQWEYPDRILMSDFNADNQKIEAALDAEAAARQDCDTRAHPILLKTAASGETARKVSLEFPGIGWEKHAFVVLELHLPSAAEFYVRFNGGGRCSYYPNTSSDAMMAYAFRPTTLYRMICPVLYRADLPLQLFGMGWEYCMGMSNLPLREIHTMELESYDSKAPADSRIPAGTRLLVWGIQ